MAFPVLFHDEEVGETACTGCMACVNYCPTECISVTVARNPRHASGASGRRTIATSFVMDLAKCIECGICVDVCDYNAIGLGLDERPMDKSVVDMGWLEDRGREYVRKVGPEAASAKPDVKSLLQSVRHLLPPASASDGARRAWSRLRSSRPVDLRVEQPRE